MLWKSEDLRTEVNLSFLMDENEQVTDTVVFEVLTPVYPTHTRQYDALMDKMQKMRDRIYGTFARVGDLSSVPLEVGIRMPLKTRINFQDVECVNLFIVYEEATRRNRYVYVGKPKPEFKVEDMRWVDHLQVEAPKPRLT